ncbi:MAG: dihydrodipicolinate synthase family protein [Terriglobales bacterium]
MKRGPRMIFQGVLPAITTAFGANLNIDHGFVGEHARRLIAAGCTGLVALGSLGEAATLTEAEKLAVLGTLARVLAGRAPLVAGISALSTTAAVELARAAEAAGCAGLMVLPPYVYEGDWAEMKAHVGAILRATRLPAMLYNNPVAYGTDFHPEQIAELAAQHANLEAVKESSTDARRVTAIRALCGDRLQILAGVDDCVLESVAMGASGWVAGVANALPEATVEMFNAARGNQPARASELYHWLLPVLRMDTVPKFVQLIKLLQQEADLGNERVRPPRLVLAGAERAAALETMRAVLARRDRLIAAPAGSRA